ncbi:hypothetical protein, partial [Salipiger marinus]|uniref:hypothetical protein n=1 Tax=Salipiger marinus TaxID=555512 RepID=UPI001A96C587
MFAGLPGRGNKDLIDEEFRCKTPSREALEISQGERTVPELGRVDKRDSHRATGMIQAGVYDGDQLGTKSYV